MNAGKEITGLDSGHALDEGGLVKYKGDDFNMVYT
jgi:hypothetical protein